MERNTYRNVQNFILFITIMVLIAAFYIEHANHLEPCPLCIMQRLCTFVMGFMCFLGFGMASMKRAKFIAIMQLLVGILGIYFASRQLWLQALPSVEGKMCMPVFESMTQNVSFGSFLKAFLWGSSNCGEITWQGFGISMPAWALGYFIFMSVTNLVILVLLQLRLDKIDTASLS